MMMKPSSSTQHHHKQQFQQQHTQQQKVFLSNATYKRNTKRHHQQQQQQQKQQKQIQKTKIIMNQCRMIMIKMSRIMKQSCQLIFRIIVGLPPFSFLYSLGCCGCFRLLGRQWNSYNFSATHFNGSENISTIFSNTYNHFGYSTYNNNNNNNNNYSANTNTKRKRIHCWVVSLLLITSLFIFSMTFIYSTFRIMKMKSNPQRQRQRHSNDNNNNYYYHNHNNHHINYNDKDETGAWSNCTKQLLSSSLTSSSSSSNNNNNNNKHHYHHYHDQRITTVSCHTVQYRIKKSHLLQMKHNSNHYNNNNSIVIGVLSSGGYNNTLGFLRRQSIRNTWGMNHTGIFFIVAKPFTSSTSTSSTRIDGGGDSENVDINHHEQHQPEQQQQQQSEQQVLSLEEEYEQYDDLLWIDEDEVYNGETSVLTYKTLSFVNIIYDLVMEDHEENGNDTSSSSSSFVKYIFKTDDDSYIHVKNLHNHLLSSTPTSTTSQRDYWGECKTEQIEPLRSSDNKWAVSKAIYPERLYPKYCQGAGFALSWKFIQCAASSSSGSGSSSNNSHIANARYMPFEDVAVGLIAKRCHIEPTNVENPNWMHMYRFDRSEEKWRVNQGLERMPKSKLPKPDMDGGRIVQHRIYDDWDMKEHHKIVMDKEKYDRESKVQWYYRPEDS